jgi:hypothetical protein
MQAEITIGGRQCRIEGPAAYIAEYLVANWRDIYQMRTGVVEFNVTGHRVKMRRIEDYPAVSFSEEDRR